MAVDPRIHGFQDGKGTLAQPLTARPRPSQRPKCCGRTDSGPKPAYLRVARGKGNGDGDEMGIMALVWRAEGRIINSVSSGRAGWTDAVAHAPRPPCIYREGDASTVHDGPLLYLVDIFKRVFTCGTPSSMACKYVQ
jgi:hypothetical protein